jgi:hypothetical protein
MGFRRKNKKDGAGSVRHRGDAKGYKQPAFTCQAHQRQTWVERAEAKRAIRTMRWHGNDVSRMREYRCSVTGHWHVGHMPPDVVAGVISMEEAQRTMDRRDARRAKRESGS